MFKPRFLTELRSTFRLGGLTCSLSERELIEFHNFLEKRFPFEEENRRKQGLVCVGKQPNEEGPKVWVLSPDIHIDDSGKLIPTSQSKYAWQPIGGPNIELTTARNSSMSLSLGSKITLPLESAATLKRLLEMMKSILKHNFVAGLEKKFIQIITNFL